MTEKVAKLFDPSLVVYWPDTTPVDAGVATNESLEASDKEISKAGAVVGSKGAANGGKARASKLSPERRKEIARLGGLKRWGKPVDIL